MVPTLKDAAITHLHQPKRSFRQFKAAELTGPANALRAIQPVSSSADPVVVGVGMRTVRTYDRSQPAVQPAVAQQLTVQMSQKFVPPKNFGSHLPGKKKKITVFGLREPTGVFKANQEEMRRRPVKPPVAREWKRTYVMEENVDSEKKEGIRSSSGESFEFL